VYETAHGASHDINAMKLSSENETGEEVISVALTQHFKLSVSTIMKAPVPTQN
jgi:hypothetical protein